MNLYGEARPKDEPQIYFLTPLRYSDRCDLRDAVREDAFDMTEILEKSGKIVYGYEPMTGAVYFSAINSASKDDVIKQAVPVPALPPGIVKFF